MTVREENPSKRPRWQSRARWLVAASAAIAIAYVVDWTEVVRILASARLDVLLLAAGLLVLGNVTIAWRWQMLLAPVRIYTTLWQSFQSYMKGLFMGYFVPSGATSDVVKAIDMNLADTRGRNEKGLELASSIFVERGFGAFTVAMAVILGLFASPLVGEHSDQQYIMFLSAVALLVCCTFALYADKLLVLIPQGMLVRFPWLSALVTRAMRSMVAYRSAPWLLVWIMLLSVLIQALRIVPVYMISIAIGVGGEFFPYLIAVPVIFMVNMVPVLGSRIGTEQGLFVLFLGLAGVDPEQALVIALLSLAIGILVALPGGYWLIKGRAAGHKGNGGSREPPLAKHRSQPGRWRWLAALFLVGTVVLGGLTLATPGYLRLALMQPARDLLFFNRELQPAKYHSGIERRRPQPDSTVLLRADDASPGDIDLMLDAWLPAQDDAAPVVLLLHGSSPRGRALGFNMLLAEHLRQAGWLVLTPDARGFGDSGTPENPADPASWSVKRDLERLFTYARKHPKGNGIVVAVGHSLGGSHLLTLEPGSAEFAAIALLGPSRHSSDKMPTWWERVRYSSDRKIPQVLPTAVVATEMKRQDLRRLAADGSATVIDGPILLKDGEREGERLIDILGQAADLMGPQVSHVTVPGSHHYCGAYQLPWPGRAVFVRPEVFERCFSVIHSFLADAAMSTREDLL